MERAGETRENRKRIGRGKGRVGSDGAGASKVGRLFAISVPRAFFDCFPLDPKTLEASFFVLIFLAVANLFQIVDLCSKINELLNIFLKLKIIRLLLR